MTAQRSTVRYSTVQALVLYCTCVSQDAPALCALAWPCTDCIHATLHTLCVHHPLPSVLIALEMVGCFYSMMTAIRASRFRTFLLMLQQRVRLVRRRRSRTSIHAGTTCHLIVQYCTMCQVKPASAVTMSQSCQYRSMRSWVR